MLLRETISFPGLKLPAPLASTVGRKSHDPFSHKKCMEAGVMTFMAHCTWQSTSMNLLLEVEINSWTEILSVLFDT